MATAVHQKNFAISGKRDTYLLKPVAFALPVVIAGIFLAVKLSAPDTYTLLVQEDTAIEWAQALFFFLSSVIAFLIFYRFFCLRLYLHGTLYCLLAAGLLFISLEEISWGQRILNIENPSFFDQHNMQGELTLHNLSTVAPLLSKFYILIGLYGTFGFLLLSIKKLRRQIPLLNYFVPAWYIGPYFFFVFFIYTFLSYIRPYGADVLGIKELEIGYFFIFRDQEPAELLLSIGFFLFVTINYLKLQKQVLVTSAKVTNANAAEPEITIGWENAPEPANNSK